MARQFQEKVVVVVGERQFHELVGHTDPVQFPVQLARLRRRYELAGVDARATIRS